MDLGPQKMRLQGCFGQQLVQNFKQIFKAIPLSQKGRFEANLRNA